MSKNPYRNEREEIDELLRLYANLKSGRGFSYIDEDGFGVIIDHFIDNEKYNDALEAADTAINQFGYSSALLVKKADVLLSLRKYREALFTLEKAELLDATDTTLYIIKTEALLALDRQEEAAEILESAIKRFDGEEKIDLLFELADVYDDHENFEKVFDCLKLILENDPINEEALYKICFWTDFTGRNEESIKLHQQILDEHPYSELAWFNLGAAYQGIKLYEKAIDAYQYAVAIDEKFDYAYRNIGDAYIKLRKFKEAIEVLENVLNLSRPEAVIYEAIGHCYDKTGFYAQARFNYKKASHLNPEDSQLHYKIASTYMNEGTWQNAVKSLQTALNRHVMQPEYNLAMGRCLFEMGNLEDAITYFGIVVRVRPRNISGWNELLKCLYAAELFEEGFEYAALAFENTDGKPLFLYFKSLFLFATGNTKQALIYLEHSLSAAPKLIKQFLELNPSMLQHQQVVDLIAKAKKTKSRKKQ